MNWVYRFDERALKELKKLGHQAQRDILAYLDERVAGDADTRRFGKGLKADLAGLWRYRVGDFRILCHPDQRSGVADVGGGCRSSQRRLRVATSFARLAIKFQLGGMGDRADSLTLKFYYPDPVRYSDEPHHIPAPTEKSNHHTLKHEDQAR